MICRRSIQQQRSPSLGLGARLLVLLALSLVAGWIPSARAATRIWDGAGTNAFWDTVTNWNNDALPVSGDTVQFGSGFGSGTNINLNGNRTTHDLIINTITGFSITNSTLTLTAGDLTRNDVTGTEANHTIASGIALGADGAWIINGSGQLEVSGVISGARKITKTGTGTLLLSANNTFANGFVLNGGTLLLGNDNAVGSGTFTLSSGTVQSSGGARTIANNLTLASFTIGGSDDLTFSGIASFANDITITVDNTATTTFSGALNSGQKIYKYGAGKLVLTADNAQLETYVNEGVLNIQHAGALGTVKKTVVYGGGALEIQGGLAMGNETLDLYGSGINGGGALRSLSAGQSWAGVITLKSNATIASDSGTFTISSAIGHGAFAGTYSGAGDITASGIISGTGGLFKEGAGTLTLSGTASNTLSGAVTVNAGTLVLNKTAGLNAYAGTLTVGDGTGGANADVVRLNADNQMPSTAVTVNSSGWLDLNNHSDTISSLTMNGGTVSSGTGTLTVGADLISGPSSSTATISGNLNVGGDRYFYVSNGAATVDMEISASISGSGWLDKYSDGRLLLSGSNSYAGIMYLEYGQLRISNSNALGTTAGRTEIYTAGSALELDGNIAVGNELLWLKGSGTAGSGALLNVGGTNSWAGNVLLNSASTIGSDAGRLTIGGNITNAGYLATFAGAGDVTVNGIISGAGGLTKNGAGTLTLGGANTFTGNIAVNGGTLMLGSSDRIVDSVNLTLNGAKLHTGGYNETVGTLTLTANSIIDFGNATSVVHFANITGVSWTGGTTLIISNWTGSYAGGGPDQLFFGTGTNGLTGSQLGQIRFTDGSGNMQMANILANGEVVPIPEPATVAAVLLLGLGVGWHERKKIIGRLRKLS